MTDYWFKPKFFGYGASPANWKGWAATFGYAGVVFVITAALMIWPVAIGSRATSWQIALWLLLVCAMTVAFLRFARAKTDGEWRWRWGKDE